jgi:prepilin-type processing-associated H-X9-DG protein
MVIAIISVLAALLLPVLASAKNQARRTNCMSNLRQLDIALQVYVQEQGIYPLATAGDGLGSWQRALEKEGVSNIFCCPQSIRSSADYMKIVHAPATIIQPYYGYNCLGAMWKGLPPFNLGLGGEYAFVGTNVTYTPAREGRVVAPSQMIAMGDSGAFLNPGQTNVDAATLLYLAFPYVVLSVNRLAVGDWHNGGANMVFCDGHCEFAKQAVWAAATDAERELWNNDHQPHEELW